MEKIRNDLVLNLFFLICSLMIASFSLFLVQGVEAKGPLEDNSLIDVKQRGKLLVGVDIPYGIMEFYDQTGQPTGIDIELAQEIASRLEVSAEFKNMPFSELFNALDKRTVDVVISAVTITPERMERMLFSVPYLDAGMTLAVKSDNTEIQSLGDLTGKRVGVLKGTVGEKLVSDSEHFKSAVITRYEKNDARIQDLMNGKIDAVVVHFLVKNKPGLKNLGDPLSESYYGIATHLKNRNLMDAINKILRDLKRSEKIAAIKKKYMDAP